MRKWIRSSGLLGLILLSTFAAGWRAWGSARPPEIGGVRRKVLAAIPRDATVLINVTAADMPASPDVLALGKRSTRALERCLANNSDDSLRGYCADLLGVLGDPTALPTLQVALEDWDPGVRRRVIVALGKIPHETSLAPLLVAFGRKDEASGNRAAILTVLGTLGHPKAVKVLRRELERQPTGEDLRPDAFRALWRSRHLLSRSTLVDVVADAIRSDNETLVYDAILRAAELRPRDCVKPLLAVIEHPRQEIRNKAIYALGLIGDRRAIPPLLTLLPRVREARELNNIAFALERIDKPAFYTQIRRLIEHQQAVIRLNATFVVGDVRSPDGLPLIEQALRDPSERVKIEAIEALGKLPPNAAVRTVLERAMSDPSEHLRSGALGALADRPVDAPLVRLFERALHDASEEIQDRAIIWLGQHGTAASIPALERFVALKETPRWTDAIYAIYRLSGGKRSDLVYDNLFLSPDAASVRRAAVTLGQSGDLRVRDYLLACMESRGCAPADLGDFLEKDRDPRTSGRVLLAWAGPREADLNEIVGTLRPAGTMALAQAKLDGALARSDGAAVRRSIDLMVALRDESARQRLQPVASLPDLLLRQYADIALVRLGDRAAEARLLANLDNLPAEWLPAFARRLMAIEEPAARARLSPELERREAGPDYPIALAAASVRLAWTPDAAFPRFLRALASGQVLERELGERYLWQRSPAIDALIRRAFTVEKNDHVRDELHRLLEVRG